MKNTSSNTWTPQHQDLHDALIAQQILPNFCRRISLEHTTIDHARARSWRAWAGSLTNDPGWLQIQAILELPDAWPSAWHALPPDAWSPQTAHFNTLFFVALVSDALADQNFDVALYAFKEAFTSANRALQPTDDASLAFSELPSNPIFTLLTQPPFHDLENLFKIHPDPATDTLDHGHDQRAQFAWQALLHAQSVTHSAPLTPVVQHANQLIEHILEHIHADIFQCIDTLDANSSKPEHFHEQFQHIARLQTRIQPRADNFYPIFEYTLVAATNTIAAAVLLAKRDDEFEILQPLLKLVQPFNDILRDELKIDPTMTENFRDACAEFFVLQGELQTNSEQRLHHFEQAIDIAPDHPRAAQRAAQTCLERANTLLLVTAPAPGFAAQFPGGHLLVARVKKARDLYFRAYALDPTNDLLPTYHAEISLECQRFDIPFEQKADPQTPQEPPHDR